MYRSETILDIIIVLLWFQLKNQHFMMADIWFFYFCFFQVISIATVKKDAQDLSRHFQVLSPRHWTHLIDLTCKSYLDVEGLHQSGWHADTLVKGHWLLLSFLSVLNEESDPKVFVIFLKSYVKDVSYNQSF